MNVGGLRYNRQATEIMTEIMASAGTIRQIFQRRAHRQNIDFGSVFL